MTRAGIASAVLVLCLTVGTLCAVIWRSEGNSALGESDWAAVRFTVIQAALSALISVVLAVPVARAIARRSFSGRSLLVTLLGAPFILPVIVAILGLLAVFGRNGLVNIGLNTLGLPNVQIFGIHGVILAHVFFNLPLATRLILQGWTAIPAEHFRLAASMDFKSWQIFRVLEWPMLRSVLPGAFMVIFLICTTSFAVALALGGGPRATTVELAIYQAFRLEFDLSKAAQLAIVQFGLSGTAAMLAIWLSVPTRFGGGLDRVTMRWDARNRATIALDAILIIAAGAFLITPLLMILVRGFPGLWDLPTAVWGAAARSILVALVSAALCLAMVFPWAIALDRLASRSIVSRGLEVSGYLAIAASPLVIGTGLFILLFPIADPFALALPVTALVNAVMSLPFALRILAPAVAEVEDTYGKLADSLGLKGWNRVRAVLLPRLRRQLGFSAGLAAALSMGDLGVIALFGDADRSTLPLMIYRLMSAYKMDAAMGAALLLLALSLALFWVFDRGGRIDADT